MKVINKFINIFFILACTLIYACKDDETDGNVSSISLQEFSPTEALIGAEVTIKGSGFKESSVVWFNETKAEEIISVDNNTIVVRVPVAATGRIGVLDGEDFAFFDNDFTVIPGAVITGYSPVSALPGETIVISGTDFHELGTENVSVVFGGDVAAAPLSVTSNSISVVVPRGAVTGSLSVAFDGMETVSGPSFEVLVPEITGYSPEMAAIGAEIGISVSNFPDVLASDITVKFSGSETNAEVISFENGVVTVRVPDGAVTGLITIEADGYTIEGAEFVVTPEITGFNPESAKVGAEITMQGSNFPVTGNAEVFFSAADGQTVSAEGTFTSEGLKVSVPTGAVTGCVYFMMNEVKIESSTDFTVIESFNYAFTCKDVAKSDDTNYAISSTINPCDYSNEDGNGSALGEWKNNYRGTDASAKGMVIWDAKQNDYVVFKVDVTIAGEYKLSFDAKLATSSEIYTIEIAVSDNLSSLNNSSSIDTNSQNIEIASGNTTDVSKAPYNRCETANFTLSQGTNYVRILYANSCSSYPVLRKVKIFN